MLSILLTLGLERVIHDLAFSWYAPISSVIAAGFMSLNEITAIILYYTFWWAHLLILLAFLVYVPQSKHFHLMVAPINIFFQANRASWPIEKP